MFRRAASGFSGFFRFAQQASAGASAGQRRRVLAGIATVQLGAAAAVALTDQQLKKKPYWYREAVKSLEFAINKTGKYGYIESAATLARLHDSLQRVCDLPKTELLWRFARVLVEEGDLNLEEEQQEKFYREAEEFGRKAISFEGSTPSAGAHKWYAITLTRLAKFEKKIDRRDEIRSHLVKSTEANAEDPFAWMLLGVCELDAKKYSEAVACFERAEKIKPHFSAANHFHLGMAQKRLGNKAAAIESFKSSCLMQSKNHPDKLAKMEAKKMLHGMKVKKDEYEPTAVDY